MSTLTSAQLNLKRASTKVHAPPGGGSSISFGDSPVRPPQPPEPRPASTPAKAAASPACAASPVCAEGEQPRVGVAIAGSFAAPLLRDAMLAALSRLGLRNITVRCVADPLLLPYAAKSLAATCCAVFAGAVLSAEQGESQSVLSTVQHGLMEVGVAGVAPVVPGVTLQPGDLAAKVMVPQLAEQWAASVRDALQLASNPAAFDCEFAIPEEPAAAAAPVLTPALEDVDQLMQLLRLSLKSHGVHGIFSIGRKFRIVDDDRSGTIDFPEFQKMVAEHAMGWTEGQLAAVFGRFDRDKSGGICFDEFLRGVRQPMNERRKQLTLMAFEILDADKSGCIELNDIEAKYDASKHPDVIAGKRTTSQILREFLDTFDSVEEKDGKVTPAEFIDYYENVSASIDDDDYYELMIRNAWHISGGEGWCANSSNRRVLVTHVDGAQTVEEIKNDLGIGPTDKDKMMANLKAQGITTAVSIDVSGSADNTTPPTAAPPAAVTNAPASASANNTPVKASAGKHGPDDASHAHANAQTGRFSRGSGQTLSSSITFG